MAFAILPSEPRSAYHGAITLTRRLSCRRHHVILEPESETPQAAAPGVAAKVDRHEALRSGARRRTRPLSRPDGPVSNVKTSDVPTTIEAAPPKAVLCLDDDVEVCELLEHLLSAHRVIATAHAYVALELLEREVFDLFILDIQLPDMDGIELCKRIRGEDPNTPIIFCSGAAGLRDRQNAMEAGASTYLAKPLEPESLRARVQDLLNEADCRSRRAEEHVLSMIEGAARHPEMIHEDLAQQELVSELRARIYRAYIAEGGTPAHFYRMWRDVRAVSRG